MLGYAAIFLALLATGVSVIFYFKAFLLGSNHSKGERPSNSEQRGSLFYKTAACMIVLAAGWLYYIILSDNFRYEYVVGYSARNQALAYKISAFWAGQEGSLLFWTLFHALFGLILTRKKAPAAMMAYCGLQLFLLIILLVKSPFKALAETQPDGMGLNPLLQDPWMVIHPPILFLGYAALAIPFAWAIHGLLTGRHKDVIVQALPWTLFAWSSLGAGIFIGGFWAYKVLGWGGYWAWDPVENSSLVPWLITGALLHMLLLARVGRAAVKYVYLTAILNFALVLYGTYLTRSGVLNDFSTHSFNDEGVGGLLASFVLITAVSGLAVLIWRWSRLPVGPLYPAIKSREFCLLAAAILLTTVGVMVFIGMSTPLITMFLGNPRSVAMSFYNVTSLPLVTAMVLLLAGGSSLTWGENPDRSCRKHYWLLAIVLAVVASTLAFGMQNFFAVVTVGLAAAAIAASGLAIHNRVLSWSAGLTHVGVAVALIGIMFSSLSSQSVSASFEAGVRREVLGIGITYLGKQKDVDGKGFYHQFKMDDPEGAMLRPHTKENEAGGPSVREPGIYRGLTADIYLAPVINREQRPELKLRKGEQGEAEGLDVKFVRFIMDGDNGPGKDIKAYALLEVSKDGIVQQVKPGMTPRNGQMLSLPDTAFNRYEISLISIDMKEGVARIALRDLTPLLIPEKVEAEVSRKPLMNLVWLGTIILTLATGWAAIGRSRSAASPYLGGETAPSDPYTT